MLDDYLGERWRKPRGLAALHDLEDISVIAAPGAAADKAIGLEVMKALAANVEKHRYRFAVLDTPPGLSINDARAFRQLFDASRAALYFPWVKTADPLSKSRRGRIALPPSGFVAGVYAQVDGRRGVHKAPANEVIRSAVGFERSLSSGEVGVLTGDHINALRSMPGRGHRIWGARTLSSDPEWKYVNIRRYLSYLQKSIHRGTQWMVFEPNDEPLWTEVRRAVEDFLYAEFRNGCFAGASTRETYFVRCGRKTMTQHDIDNGRLICEIGVAMTRPAEFVVFRIGQKTADAHS